MKTLREWRRTRLLTSTELAEKADVSPATIWRIESGETKVVRVKTIRQIAAVLDVPPEDIAEFAPAANGDTG